MASVDRLYEQFKPFERALLTLEALARGDEREQERLRQSCPRRAYTMTDPAYHETLEFVQDLTLIVLVDLRWYMGKLHMAEMFRGLATDLTSRHALAARVSFLEGMLLGQGEPAMLALAGGAPNTTAHATEAPDHDEDTDPEPMTAEDKARWEIPEKLLADADAALQRIIRPTIDRLAVDFKSVWAAYDRFVRRELNFEPLLVLGVFCPQVAEQVKFALEVYAKAEPDEEEVKEFVEAMDKAWARCKGKG